MSVVSVILPLIAERYRLGRHDGRYRMFVYKLRMAVAPQQHAEVVEPGNHALKFYPVYQEDGDGNFAFSDGIQKSVLKILFIIGQGIFPVFQHRIH